MPTLFDPLVLGALTLPNRIPMAPLTRCRARPRRLPNPRQRTEQAQRATAGASRSEADAAGCPIFPGPATRLHWPFDDPSKFTGTHEERLAQTRRVRAEIHANVQGFCAEQGDCRS